MQLIERPNRIHPAFAALHVGAASGGLIFGEPSVNLNVAILVILFTLLRVNAWFDDKAYFEDVDRERLPGGVSYGLGMFLTVASWVAWTFAGLHLKDLQLCALFLAIVFGISAFWIIAAMARHGACAEQIPCLCLNGFYSLGFLLLYSRNAMGNPGGQSSSEFETPALVLLLLLFLIDMKSRQFTNGHSNRRRRDD